MTISSRGFTVSVAAFDAKGSLSAAAVPLLSLSYSSPGAYDISHINSLALSDGVWQSETVRVAVVVPENLLSFVRVTFPPPLVSYH